MRLVIFIFFIFIIKKMLLPDNWILGLSVTLLLTLASLFSKKIDPLGAIVGGMITFCLFLGSQWLGIILLTVFFGFGTLVSQWKIRQKAALGLAQAQKGKRTIVNVIANGGVAGVCGLLAFLIPSVQMPLELAMTATIAAATSDTFSSELGNLYGKKYINILTGKPDKRGKDGVISLEGTLAGVVGCLIIALIFVLFRGFQQAVLWIFISGMLGNFADSVLGAAFQQKGWLDNHQVNLLNTIISALAVLCCYFLF